MTDGIWYDARNELPIRIFRLFLLYFLISPLLLLQSDSPLFFTSIYCTWKIAIGSPATCPFSVCTWFTSVYLVNVCQPWLRKWVLYCKCSELRPRNVVCDLLLVLKQTNLSRAFANKQPSNLCTIELSVQVSQQTVRTHCVRSELESKREFWPEEDIKFSVLVSFKGKKSQTPKQERKWWTKNKVALFLNVQDFFFEERKKT